MADKLTPQQEMAVNNQGGNLLVSAAAGSGKTKVLVDRLLRYITNPNDPANIDEFLIITYTKAAAQELRGKIAVKLTQAVSESAHGKHLRRQMQLLHRTKISTVHAFCADILREYAFELGIPGDFRVADENECKQMRLEVMTQLLEEEYRTANKDSPFFAFINDQGFGRDDRQIPKILLKLYDSARCHLNPQKWLDGCVENTASLDITDVSQTIWGRYLMDDLFSYLDMQIEAIGVCYEQAKAAGFSPKLVDLLLRTLEQLQYLRQSETWDQLISRKNIAYGTLTIAKSCPEPELGARIKAVRNACKDSLTKRLKRFASESSVILEDMAKTAPSVQEMVRLVNKFSDAYQRMKQSRRVMDFGDLEHEILSLLLDSSGRPKKVADQIGSRFREVMVDEYQDSNEVQDAIFSALTHERRNCFMVGDVKQSIYQFRLADPTIFLKKYQEYVDAEKAQAGQGRKVMLSANFRSGGDVLKSVNDIFRLCMCPNVGGLYYGEEEALREGIPHNPLGEPEVELWAIDVQEKTYPEEAAFVAKRIRELTDGSHFVRQGDQLRPITPEDIVILLRSPGSIGKYYMEALEKVGIRCTSGGGEDLLKTQEIASLRALLQTISNPRQDIPLIATMASPVFGFTADELAKIRCCFRGGCMYDALLASSDRKAINFLETLKQLRIKSKLISLPELIKWIFLTTKMDRVFGAMDGGAVRIENLYTFYSMISGMEGNGRNDLDAFLEHLVALEEKGLVVNRDPAATGVTMMSIHKSKGLEFPVVFVCGLSKRFNQEDAKAQVLCNTDLGLGMSVVDRERRLRYPSLAKSAIAKKVMADGISEELRVLYVALTRARDRLIMTYASDSLQKDLAELVGCMDVSKPELMSADVICAGEWVLMAALRRSEAGALFQLGGKPLNTALGDPVWKIGVVCQDVQKSAVEAEEEAPVQERWDISHLRHCLQFTYPHLDLTITPSKRTPTQQKGRVKDEEVILDTPAVADQRRQRHSDGAERGTAMHLAMQHLDYQKTATREEINAQLDELVQQQILTFEQRKMVNVDRIVTLFKTQLGQTLRRHESQVNREFKFSVLDRKEYPGMPQEDRVLIQGVVDCIIVEDDGITIVDFKTDYVTEDTLPEKLGRYQDQMNAYANAMRRIYERRVKKCYLYFFGIGQAIEATLKTT